MFFLLTYYLVGGLFTWTLLDHYHLVIPHSNKFHITVDCHFHIIEGTLYGLKYPS
jgi:hypothetical protein